MVRIRTSEGEEESPRPLIMKGKGWSRVRPGARPRDFAPLCRDSRRSETWLEGRMGSTGREPDGRLSEGVKAKPRRENRGVC